MVNPSNRRAVRQVSVAAVLALAGILLAARPAAAQYWVAPDRSVVNLGPRQAFPIRPTLTVTPVVIPGNQYVRVGGNFSGAIFNPNTGYPGTGFVKPLTANERVAASNFYGSPTYNPNPVITGPWQKWWP
jgi:hypothetical protein